MNLNSPIVRKLWQTLEALRQNCEGQDLVEYALMAGFIVVGVVTLAPEIAASFVVVMSKVNSIMIRAGA
jgi:Flp pilus assembly pilin Flp